MSNCITQWYKRNFKDPEVFSTIAEKLREGADVVKVVRGGIVRYYTGNGRRIGNGRGHAARWDVKISKFISVPEYEYPVLTQPNFPYLDKEELAYLQGAFDRFTNVYIINNAATKPAVEIAVNINEIVRRLKPYQQYPYGGHYIRNDFIQGDGNYLIWTKTGGVLVPANRLDFAEIFTSHGIVDFDPNLVEVYDQAKIKRHHRTLTDLKRWYVVTPMDSAADNWVFQFTPDKNAGGPLRHYGFKIDISNKTMKAHPFYVHRLINDAVAQLGVELGMGIYKLNTDHILVEWDGKTVSLSAWLDNANKYPASADINPVLIYRKLNPTAFVSFYREAEVEFDYAQ